MCVGRRGGFCVVCGLFWRGVVGFGGVVVVFVWKFW